jgi:hypothetical protein
MGVVALVLGGVALWRGSWTEALAALAVLATFGHASVAERMRERQAAQTTPDVSCHRWTWGYFLAKEALWVAYFTLTGAFAALAGCAVFLVYPMWRSWWRRRHPLDVGLGVQGRMPREYTIITRQDVFTASLMEVKRKAQEESRIPAPFPETWTPKYGTLLEQLLALGDNPDLNAADKILGEEGSRTRPRCTECSELRDSTLSFKPEDAEAGVEVCLPCLTDATAQLRAATTAQR